MRGRIVPATKIHAAQMAPTLRLFARDGPYALMADDPLTTLVKSIDRSTHSWTGLISEEPVCLFGLHASSLMSAKATAWMYTTPAVERHRLTFWRGSKQVVQAMRSMYPQIDGWCDARFGASARWLARLGFTLKAPEDIGGVPFHYFEMKPHG